MKRSTVTLLGELGCGNFGTDASAVAMADAVRTAYADVTVSAVCWDVLAVPGSLRDDAVLQHPRSHHGRVGTVLGRLHDPWHYARVTRHSRLVAAAGGGMLEAGLGIRLPGRPLLLAWFALLCGLTGTDLALVDVGATEMPAGSIATLMTFAVRRARYRSFRDAQSRDLVTALGVPGARSDPVYADVVFALAGSHLDEPPVPRRLPDHPVVALGVLGPAQHAPAPGRPEYTTAMAEAARELVARGARVVLTPGDELDLGVAHTVEAIVLETVDPPSPGSVTVADVHSFDALLGVLADADLVIASRYHGLVAGLMAGKPTGALGYSGKFAALLERASMPAPVEVGAVTAESVVGLFDALAEDFPSHVAQARAARDQLARSARDQLDELVLLLAQPHGRGRSAAAHREHDVDDVA